jgi:hypothetical protein
MNKQILITDLKVCDDGILITLFTYWTYLKQCFGVRNLPPSSGKKPTQLDPIDGYSPDLRT